MGIFNKIINTWFSNSTSASDISKPIVSLSQSDKKIIEESATSMVRVINESLEIANKSVIYDTRVSRIQVVKDTLERLKELSISYPDISIISLDAVERSIELVEHETQNMKPIVRYKNILPERPNVVPQTAVESTRLHNNWMGALLADKDSGVIKGLKYYATLQLRTPLRVLLQDGETWTDGVPPESEEPWHGIWVAETKTFKELGINMKEFPESSFASDIGPVKHSKYLPFLKDIRSAVEPDESMKQRIKSLQQVLKKKKYAEFIDRHSGQDVIFHHHSPT